MNWIEQLVEALKTCTEDEYGQYFHQTQVQEAIAAGEQELKREPDGYIAWEDGKPSWDEDCVCEDAVYPVDESDPRTSMPFYVRRESK